MISLGVKNFHNLKDTGQIEIKPLNFLLGTNSSGKSSFLRIFPLLRQSIEVTTKGPILWYGDYVDFGDFQTVVRKGQKEIVFQIELKLICDSKSLRRTANDILFRDSNIKLNIHIHALNESTYIERINFSFEDQTFCIRYSKENKIINIEINGVDYSKGSENLLLTILPNGLIPRISSQLTPDKKSIGRVGTQLFFNERLYSFVEDRLRVGTMLSIIPQILKVGIGSKSNVLKQFRKNHLPKTWLKHCKDWTIESNDFNQLNNLFLGFKIGSLIELINDKIQFEFQDFYYIAPLRATAERYYRRQNLSLTEVDFQGKNLPMFINNMTPSVLLKFQEWVERFLKYYPQTSIYEGHISLKLNDRKTGESYNITDRGFGYSQLLPIITMIWSVINNHNSKKRYLYGNIDERRDVVISIEQPELHLHPALQAKMIDVFNSSIELAKGERINLKFIIETHSETMINYIGNKIFKKEIKPENINILIFGKNKESEYDITNSKYDNNGHLSQWPYGFFDPEY